MRTFAATHTLKNQKGFSLVELMVVVAIIGILASIAIPSLQRYMAKARQAEAKTNLASLYTAEKAFFAEYNTYTTCFDGIGFQPEGNLRYRTGFSTNGQDPTSYGFTGTCTLGNKSTQNVCGSGKACLELAEATSATLGSSFNFTSGTLSSTGNASNFAASAAGKIYKGLTDEWAINDTKNLFNSTVGVQ